MGQLADKVRAELQHEFFKKHRLLFVYNTREYCRECKRYVEAHCRERLVEYKEKFKTGDCEDFL